MTAWTEETPTMELRLVRPPAKQEPGWIVHYLKDRLQQKWKITRGGEGRVEYTEEWRDVPLVIEG